MAVELPTSFFSETTNEVVREITATPSIFGIGLDTALGIVAGGGALAIGFGAYRLVRYFIRKRRHRHVVKGAIPAATPDDPFPRHLDEARQQRQLAGYVERRIPEYDAAVGRIVNDELLVWQRQGTPQDNSTLKAFWEGVRGRVDRLMPPSTREYLSTEGH